MECLEAIASLATHSPLYQDRCHPISLALALSWWRTGLTMEPQRQLQRKMLIVMMCRLIRLSSYAPQSAAHSTESCSAPATISPFPLLAAHPSAARSFERPCHLSPKQRRWLETRTRRQNPVQVPIRSDIEAHFSPGRSLRCIAAQRR